MSYKSYVPMPQARDFKWKTDNKLKGAFGITDYGKKEVRINKKIHEVAKKKGTLGIAKKDATIINTLVHEQLHTRDSKMPPKEINRIAKVTVQNMSAKQKKAMYSKVS